MKSYYHRIFTDSAEFVKTKHRNVLFRTLILGSLMATGACTSDNEMTFTPGMDDVCTTISASALEPNYEADRWADMADLPRLEKEISSSLKRTGGHASYGICFNNSNQAHAIDPDIIEQIKKYGLDRPRGYVAGVISVPGVISPQSMAAIHETSIHGTHGF